MPVVVFNTVDGADIGMVQLRRGARLAGKTLHRLGVAYEVFRNELQGDVAPEFEVFALVDNAHTTAPKFAENAVMGYLLADHESARPCSAVMLGPQPNPVNSLISRGLQSRERRGSDRRQACAQANRNDTWAGSEWC